MGQLPYGSNSACSTERSKRRFNIWYVKDTEFGSVKSSGHALSCQKFGHELRLVLSSMLQIMSRKLTMGAVYDELDRAIVIESLIIQLE